MPITRRQFDLGINETLEEVMQRVHLHLSVHRAEAYSSDELAESLDVSSGTMLDALEKLQVLGAIEARQVGPTDYFAYRRDLPSLH